jgi:isoleucyl-tRNA synthetase
MAQQDHGVTVVLDTNLTEDLINEGYAREVISKVQTMRRDADFDVTDRIDIVFTSSDKLASAVETGRDMITKATLALSLERGEADESFTTSEWDINGEKAVIGVRVHQ